jgi:hypothetical protein
MKRNKNLKTIKQLSKEEENKISLEFKRIYDLLFMIKKDEHNQLKEFESKEIIGKMVYEFENVMSKKTMIEKYKRKGRCIK